MSHHARTNSIAILGVLVLLTSAIRAQDRAADVAGTPPAGERGTLRVYHTNVPVSELARVLQQVAGERDVTIIPEVIGNVLIVRGAEEDLESFDALIEHLDQPSRRITFSLTVLEVDDAVDAQNADPAELLRTLTEESPHARIREIRLTSLENQMAQVQLGEQRPVVSGVSVGRDGSRVNSYQQQEFGTILSMTARVGEDRRIVAEVSFEMSRLEESSDATASTDDGIPPARRIVTLRTTVGIPDGETVLLTDFDSQDSPGETRIIGFVTASAE